MRRETMLVVHICIAVLFFALPVQAYTEEVHIVKYAADGTTILDETTVNYTWMEANLPVHGDGSTHYYYQGPVFEGDKWDPNETINFKDRGAVKGTNVKDLCDLVGGISPSETLWVSAPDGCMMVYDYDQVMGDFTTFDPDGLREVSHGELTMILMYEQDGEIISDNDGKPLKIAIVSEDELMSEEGLNIMNEAYHPTIKSA